MRAQDNCFCLNPDCKTPAGQNGFTKQRSEVHFLFWARPGFKVEVIAILPFCCHECRDKFFRNHKEPKDWFSRLIQLHQKALGQPEEGIAGLLAEPKYRDYKGKQTICSSVRDAQYVDQLDIVTESNFGRSSVILKLGFANQVLPESFRELLPEVLDVLVYIYVNLV